MSEIVRTVRISRPRDAVFAMLADHEGMSRWPGVKRALLVKEGSPRNGVGAIRRITAGGLTLDEEIVEFDPPGRLAYTIIKGLPVKHLGTVSLTDEGGATRVEWHVKMTSFIPLLAPLVCAALGRGLQGALNHVKRELEK
jgi:uncharacterized protein YndB with AHSA1/START domain